MQHYVDGEFIEHLRAVLAYAEIGEEQDYEEQDDDGKANHILNDIRALKGRLENQSS